MAVAKTRRRTKSKSTNRSGGGKSRGRRKSSGKRRSESSPGETIGRAVGDALSKVGEVVGNFLRVNIEFQSLRDFFVKELHDLYSAEQQLVEALPQMANAATATELRRAFEEHLTETETHVDRLEEVFREIGERPSSEKCKAMSGLVAEGSEWMNEDAKPGVKDVGLIACAQRVEHYEIAGYGCVRTYARLLGYRRAAEVLQTTLDEEGAADKKLTKIAKRLNVEAGRGREANGGRNGGSRKSGGRRRRAK
jgi:ferritin-like metal-binding protein YciE